MSAEMTPISPRAIVPLESIGGGYQPLNRHVDRVARVDHIATISAGSKDAKGIPFASRDGRIYISDAEGRAPGLAAALHRGEGKRLTIAMPSDNYDDFISETFRKEGKTRLEAWGDHNGITTIAENGARHFHPAGTQAFETLRAACKVQTNILFLLAEYDENGQPVVVWPDGLGVYRLRTTSHNTRDNLISQLARISALTGGHIAGFPLDVALVYRTLADPTGAKRKPPVFIFTLRPPQTLRLDSRTFARLAASARQVLAPLETLALPPAAGTLEGEIQDYQAQLTTGVDKADARARWFAFVKDTELDSDAARGEFIAEHTDGRFVSLAAFLDAASQEEVEALLEAVLDATGRRDVDAETGEVKTVDAELVESEDGEFDGEHGDRDYDDDDDDIPWPDGPSTGWGGR